MSSIHRRRAELTADIAVIDTATVTERLSRTLRRLIGPGQRWSYAAVAAATGIDQRSLKAYVQGTACPDLVRWKRLLAALGPEIGHDLNILQGMAPRRDETPPEALDLSALRRDLVRAGAILSGVLGAAAGALAAPEPVAAGGPSAETLPAFRRPLGVRAIDRAAVTSRFGFRLRRMIGPGRPHSLAEVAAASGVDARTLRAYLAGTACPNLARYLRLVQVLGPESGYELALMLGWRPRHRPAALVPQQPAVNLASALQAALVALDELAGGRVDLICPGDRLAEGARRRQPEMPDSVQM